MVEEWATFEWQSQEVGKSWWESFYIFHMDFTGGATGGEPVCQCRRHKGWGFNPWFGKNPGGGHGNPFRYSCLGNPIDRGAWRAAVHRVTKSQTRLKWLSMHACIDFRLDWFWTKKKKILRLWHFLDYKIECKISWWYDLQNQIFVVSAFHTSFFWHIESNLISLRGEVLYRENWLN